MPGTEKDPHLSDGLVARLHTVPIAVFSGAFGKPIHSAWPAWPGMSQRTRANSNVAYCAKGVLERCSKKADLLRANSSVGSLRHSMRKQTIGLCEICIAFLSYR